jgi:hypothetical protein
LVNSFAPARAPRTASSCRCIEARKVAVSVKSPFSPWSNRNSVPSHAAADLERHRVPSPIMPLTTSWSGTFFATISPVPSNGIWSRWLTAKRGHLAEFADSNDFGRSFRAEVGHLFRLMSAGHSD